MLFSINCNQYYNKNKKNNENLKIILDYYLRTDVYNWAGKN